MTNDDKKLTDGELENATGAGPGISAQKASGRGGMTAGGGGLENTTASTGSGNEGAPEHSAYPDGEEPK
jgi:hypothetical protein